MRARSAKALIYFLIRLLITDRSITFAGFINLTQFITARSELRKVLFLALSVTFCVRNVSGTAERICAKFTGKICLSLARTSLNVKVKSQGYRGQKTAFSALSMAYMRFMFGRNFVLSTNSRSIEQ